jgi:hypothetical protein
MRQTDVKVGQQVRATGKSIFFEEDGAGRIGHIDEIYGQDEAVNVRWENGDSNTFYTKDLEPVVEMKICDRVKVMRAWQAGEQGTNWGDDSLFKTKVGKIGKIVKRSREGDGWVVDIDGDAWLYPEFVLQKVNSKAACILTEKVMVGDVKCRKITGLEGILTEQELPDKYTNGEPAFWFKPQHGGAHIFRNGKMTWGNSFAPEYASNPGISCSFPSNDIDVGEFIFHGLHVGDIWPETTFQNILIWLKRAGSRLAKIRKQEHDAWSGCEEVSI